MLNRILLAIFIQIVIYYMESQSEDKTYSKLAAGAAAVFFPLTIYQNYKNKKQAAVIFKETEVRDLLKISFYKLIFLCSITFNTP